jgi:hypothetical protein
MSKPKIICFYLPQYHTFDENDEFWGRGFTEWNNLYDVKTFHKNQRFMRTSSEFGDYDLRSYAVRKRHAELAKEHGIDGFCLYHYWFYGHPGNKVMYEVAERMLEDGEPNINFCFEWANEPWTRTWDGMEKNYLIKQEYGDKEDWTEHFNYLLKFFKHKNYIKVNNKPMFLVYKIGHFKDFNKFKKHFNELAKKEGFDGIIFSQTLNHFSNNNSHEGVNKNADAYIEYQPMYVNRFHEPEPESNENLMVFHAPKKWEHIINLKKPKDIGDKPYIRGFYSGWDSSPRAKNRSATIDLYNDPKNFEFYLKKQLQNVINDNNEPYDYLFIFAWNEWGEGAVIEPSDLYGNQYLMAIKDALNGVK